LRLLAGLFLLLGDEGVEVSRNVNQCSFVPTKAAIDRQFAALLAGGGAEGDAAAPSCVRRFQRGHDAVSRAMSSPLILRPSTRTRRRATESSN
jgi:hypothetical protein